MAACGYYVDPSGGGGGGGGGGSGGDPDSPTKNNTQAYLIFLWVALIILAVIIGIICYKKGAFRGDQGYGQAVRVEDVNAAREYSMMLTENDMSLNTTGWGPQKNRRSFNNDISIALDKKRYQAAAASSPANSNILNIEDITEIDIKDDSNETYDV